MPYTKIKRMEGASERDVNLQLSYGMVLLGIEQRRDWLDEKTFSDVTTYILGEKEDEN